MKKITASDLSIIFEYRFLLEEGVYWMYTTDEKRIFSISESRAKLAWAMPNVEKGDEIEI